MILCTNEKVTNFKQTDNEDADGATTMQYSNKIVLIQTMGVVVSVYCPLAG